MTKQNIKPTIHSALLRENESKLSKIQTEIKELETSRNNETKSTAGDKHEVGRAMAQSELENLTKRMNELKEQHSRLKQIDLNPSKSAQVGSLVYTSKANYFISTGYGKIEVDGENIFCISAGSPIGQILLRKKAGDKITFRDQEMTITEIH